LAYIREDKGRVALGATTTLAELAESPILRALANGVAAQAAHKSAASVLRNQATLAGTLITELDGVLAVVLLALEAQVTVIGKVTKTFSLAEFFATRNQLLPRALITEIAVPMSNPRASLQTVARTPSDKPIVSVCAAARVENKAAHSIRVALGGVGETALRAKRVEQALEGKELNQQLIEKAAQQAAEGLSPIGDFRGSIEYRKEMAVVLTRRAVEELAA
jgi:carbon-monoxide dehydrogenase medium subunit